MKEKILVVRISSKQKEILKYEADKLNLNISQYVRLTFFKNIKLVKTKEFTPITYVRPQWSMNKGRRFSFFCSNRLWNEMAILTNDCYSISKYVRTAIIEKMIKDEPEKKEFFEKLLL